MASRLSQQHKLQKRQKKRSSQSKNRKLHSATRGYAPQDSLQMSAIIGKLAEPWLDEEGDDRRKDIYFEVISAITFDSL